MTSNPSPPHDVTNVHHLQCLFFFQQQPSQIPTLVDEEVFKDFPTYNREYERRRLMLEEKELKWEAELKQLMEQSS